MVRETWVQSQVTSYQRLLKLVLDTTLLNTQQYKVCIKSKVEKSREMSSAPLHLDVVAIEKGAFWSPSTTVANFTTYMKIIIYFTSLDYSEDSTCYERYGMCSNWDGLIYRNTLFWFLNVSNTLLFWPFLLSPKNLKFI